MANLYKLRSGAHGFRVDHGSHVVLVAKDPNKNTVIAEPEQVSKWVNRFEIVRKDVNPSTTKAYFVFGNLAPNTPEEEVQEKKEDGKAPASKRTKLPKKPKFKVEHIGGGKYNVVKIATGEAINTGPLTKAEATSLLDNGDLPGEEDDEDEK